MPETFRYFRDQNDGLSLIRIPVEKYLRTSYDPDMEYVDGRLCERSVGERPHSRTQIIIGSILKAREADRGFEAFTEQRVATEAGRYRIPDICVKAVPYEPVSILNEPDMVIEILSHDDTLGAVA
jgi:Uma2 family endonuclease